MKLHVLIFSIFSGESRQVWPKTRENSWTCNSLGPIIRDKPICFSVSYSPSGITIHPVNKIRTNPWFISLSFYTLNEKALSVQPPKKPVSVTHWRFHSHCFCSGPCGCLCEPALQDIPNWLSIFKFLLPLRSLSFLKANMIKVLKPSYKKNVQTLNISTLAHLHLPRPTTLHTHTAPTQCYCHKESS